MAGSQLWWEHQIDINWDCQKADYLIIQLEYDGGCGEEEQSSYLRSVNPHPLWTGTLAGRTSSYACIRNIHWVARMQYKDFLGSNEGRRCVPEPQRPRLCEWVRPLSPPDLPLSHQPFPLLSSGSLGFGFSQLSSTSHGAIEGVCVPENPGVLIYFGSIHISKCRSTFEMFVTKHNSQSVTNPSDLFRHSIVSLGVSSTLATFKIWTTALERFCLFKNNFCCFPNVLY